MGAASRGGIGDGSATGLDALWQLVLQVARTPALATGPVPASFDLLLSQVHATAARPSRGRQSPPGPDPDTDEASTVDLVRRAQTGDSDAFGQLYDRYVTGVYRFCYYRTSSTQLAEDLTSETFLRALRAIGSFRWQGRDFGAWLTTIARNLVTDHYKSGRARLETVSDQLPESTEVAPGPEDLTQIRLTHEVLAKALHRLPDEQRDCVVMRFLQGLSIAETAEALERSGGAVKQLQLRAVRNLAKWLPEDLR
jgi:RNA polymerase sigma-70 factor (ECF subfamily)